MADASRRSPDVRQAIDRFLYDAHDGVTCEWNAAATNGDVSQTAGRQPAMFTAVLPGKSSAGFYLVRLFRDTGQIDESSLASLSAPKGVAGESSVHGSIGVLISKNGRGIGMPVLRRLSEMCPMPASK